MDKKEFVLKSVNDKKDLLLKVSDQIFDYAEVGFREFKTAKLFEEVLNQELEKELIAHQVVEAPVEVPAGLIDRITVKDGSRIHLIKADELIYIQACGDYVMLITPSGEYLKEQTMKYFETHLPPETFVRVHRSTIVNVTQISRVELFGKETYQLLLKNGVKLRVSLSGYRLLKERLGL